MRDPNKITAFPDTELASSAEPEKESERIFLFFLALKAAAYVVIAVMAVTSGNTNPIEPAKHVKPWGN